MKNMTEVMKSFLDKCDIKLQGNTISKETLVQTYADFLTQTMEKRKHNVGIVMHSGSLCFDVLSIAYVVITNLLYNRISVDDVIASLVSGDFVLYGTKKKERYIYDKIIEDAGFLGEEYKGQRRIQLRQDGIEYIPESRWHLIEPYNGEAKSLDGRGIRSKNPLRNIFFEEVLEYKKEDIPNVIDVSTVIVMSRTRADKLIKGMSLKFGNEEVQLLDLITASYFTENEEHPYSGNTGKNEPILKICAKLSIARRLIKKKNGSRHIGLMILDWDAINRGQSELPELINRKSLQYVYICTPITSEFGTDLLDENEKMEVFACTRKFLLNYSSLTVDENYYTLELEEQVNAIIHKKNSPVMLDNFGIENDKYKEFKKNMLNLKRNQYTSAVKDDFIVQAFSLMKVFVTAVFSMQRLEDICLRGIISLDYSPAKKLEYLKKLAKEMPASIKDFSDRIVDILEKEYLYLLNGTPKEEWLKKYIYDNKYTKIALVVPKKYYIPVIKEFITAPIIHITTAGKFDNSRIYDVIIVIGDFDGKRFNAFKYNAAVEIISLLYYPEISSFKRRRTDAEKYSNLLDSRSTIKFLENEDTKEVENLQVIGDWGVDGELEEYISEMGTIVDTKRIAELAISENATSTAEIIAAVRFSDDSKAYFSKNYKAYVLDEDAGKIEEVNVADLCEGDSIVFTRNNNDTKDIVDSLLRQMIEDGKMPKDTQQVYKKSKEWKQYLQDYMDDNAYTVREVAKRMKIVGAPVQEATIINWLDEDTHTVGPQKMESLSVIGKLTRNLSLEERADEYFSACKTIRRLRRGILGEIGKAIMNKLSEKNMVYDSKFDVVYDKIDTLSEVLQIERIVQINEVLPLNMVNRPID